MRKTAYIQKRTFFFHEYTLIFISFRKCLLFMFQEIYTVESRH